MLRGMIRAIDSDQMDRLHEGVLRVLEKTGLRIHSRFLLQVLADAGCKVDFKKERAWFVPSLVEKQIEAQRERYKMVRSSIWYPFCQKMPDEDVAWPDEFSADFGHGAPTLYDYAKDAYRKPSIQDQIDMIRLGNTLGCVKAVCLPFSGSEFDPRIENIESARLLLMNTEKPGWVATFNGKEVKYMAELAKLTTGNDQELLRTRPPIFVNAYCTTSPLKIDRRSCEVLEEALKYKFPVNFAPMPILGATTPVTPAGSAIVAAAEILGGITAASLVAPDIYYYGTSISSEMDMKTTSPCYSTPAAILTDVVLHQLFRYKYGLVLNVDPAYCEAKRPGLQASFMKTFRQMAFGCTASLALPIGLLDNGSVFSPTQAMIDLDANRAMYKFAQGITVNEETMCVDLINELEFCQKRTYLESKHTLDHFREVLWDTLFFDRTYRTSSEDEARKSARVLEEADQAWRKLISDESPVERDPAFVKEVDRIVEAAKKDLLG